MNFLISIAKGSFIFAIVCFILAFAAKKTEENNNKKRIKSIIEEDENKKNKNIKPIENKEDKTIENKYKDRLRMNKNVIVYTISNIEGSFEVGISNIFYLPICNFNDSRLFVEYYVENKDFGNLVEVNREMVKVKTNNNLVLINDISFQSFRSDYRFLMRELENSSPYDHSCSVEKGERRYFAAEFIIRNYSSIEYLEIYFNIISNSNLIFRVYKNEFTTIKI